ncbi:hypothetical protein [Amycolatopsis sp. NPDC102389]|uniref:hypothetical protein n=1 Tax=Amycolatopsis sp. NPDC102389 TaxID=3363941 RepID=UPI00381C4F7E
MMTAGMTSAMVIAATPMAVAGFTTSSGFRLAPAAPAGNVARVGLWGPGEPAPVVLTEPEITVALAHGSVKAESWGLLVDDAARGALAGLATLGRGQLADLARRWVDDGDSTVFPPGTVVKRYAKAAAGLCRTTASPKRLAAA